MHSSHCITRWVLHVSILCGRISRKEDKSQKLSATCKDRNKAELCFLFQSSSDGPDVQQVEGYYIGPL